MIKRLPAALLAFTIAALGGCKTANRASDSGAALKTDLGYAGNTSVRDTVARYIAKDASQHCNASGEGIRVIFAGYSLFQHFPYNISGTVVRAMADAAYWPDRVNLQSFDPRSTDRLGHRSILDSGDFGGKATQRQLVIDGKPVTVCFLLVEVIWDQAAAILLEEARRFRPHKIIMTGGGVTTNPYTGEFEGGALNRAMQFSGYTTQGVADMRNVPVASPDPTTLSPILDRSMPGVQEELPMLWDGPYLAELTNPIARTIRRGDAKDIFAVESVARAKLSNVYLCNNISYVALSAVRGLPLNLAGNYVQGFTFNDPRGSWRDGEVVKIDITNAFRDTKMVGFHHIPDTETDEAQTMLGWAKVFAKVMVDGR